MSPTDAEYYRELGRAEGRQFIAEDRAEALKAFKTWRALLSSGAVMSAADRLKVEAFCEVASAEFPGE